MMSMPDRNWNPEQLSAITAFGGNLLVSAAAGSGKTAVLVERVIRMLTRENEFLLSPLQTLRRQR